MFKVKLKQTALLVLTLLATTMATAQTVNMSRYITLTVQQYQYIDLDLMAAAANTGVRIVSGFTNTVVTVGTSWTGFQNYTAGATTMTVYGDITGFDCSGNGANLTALDVSQNTELIRLYCHGNSFTTQAFNDLMCSLPARTTADGAEFFPLLNASDAAAATFMATNAQIATGKNWQVRYVAGGDISATNGTYTCPTLNMSKYITLTVTQGEQIRLDLKAAAAVTPVKIVSGSTEQTITVGRSWTGFRNYTAGAGTMTVYGDITMFDCSDNEAKLTALDVSHNTALKTLYCGHNQLTSLNVSQNTALTELLCYDNNFTTQAFDDIMCSLPARVATDYAMFYPLRNAVEATFRATNSQIAKNKNWQVCYSDDGEAIPATIGTYTCPANMSKYITLTVRQGQQIRLDLKAAADDTPVKIVSGSTEQTITVNTSGWTGYQNYTAGSTTMTVYGDIIGFDCSENGAKLTALDVSQNTALTELYCQNNQLTSLDVSHNTALTRLQCNGNNFTTQAFNDLMCSLSARVAGDNARFYPLLNASDAGAAAFMAANAQIAKNKNWQVRYFYGDEEIPATTGTYVCGGGSGSVNMSRYITLTVTQGQQIQLDLMAAAAGTKVKVVSGSTETEVTVGTDWTDFQNYTAGSTTMTVYGDIIGFDCSDNGTKLTALDVSQNTALTRLYCHGNNFTTQAFNDIMCSLPARTTADDAKFYPLNNASDAGAAAFMAANSQIAKDKNWKVMYGDSVEDIPATTGTYTCPVIGIAEVASVPLSVYPNPTTDILTIETEATGSVITLTDLTGRTVLTATATASKTTLNVSELSAGTYIVRVGNRVGKVVKR